MTTKINQHCLKNIAQTTVFQNRSSMGETRKNVVLPLIMHLLKNIAQITVFQNRSSMGEARKNVVLPLTMHLSSKKKVHNYLSRDFDLDSKLSANNAAVTIVRTLLQFIGLLVCKVSVKAYM